MRTSPSPDGPPARLTDARWRPTVIAAVTLVTLAAFENRSALTVLPLAARELDGMWLFGAASAVASGTYLLGAALGGLAVDRRGPALPLLAGLGVFVAGVAVQTLAPTMEVVIAARSLTGLGEAGLDLGVVALAARTLPSGVRAKVFSAIATAWILPSVVGPGLAGLLADWWGWRVALAAPALLALPALVALRRPLREARDGGGVVDSDGAGPSGVEEGTDGAPATGRTVLSAVLACAGVLGLALGGPLVVDGDRRVLGVTVLAGALAAIVVASRDLLPAGVLTARVGAPSVIGAQGLTGAAFTLCGSFLPLMLQSTQGLSPGLSGVTLALTGTLWAAGSNVAARDDVQARTTASGRLALGAALIAGGGAAVAAATALHGPLAALLLAWACAATGMGVASNALSTSLVDLAPAGSLGRHQAAMSSLSGMAVGTALAAGGVVVAAVGTHPLAFAAITGSGAALALAVAALAPRVRPAG